MLDLTLMSETETVPLEVVEVCVDCVESAVAALQGGASRIELCSALSEGGLTPSIGLYTKVASLVHIPIHILVRVRRGDFCYSEDEVEIMCMDILQFRKLGASRFVVGALLPTGSADERTLDRLLEAIRRPLDANNDSKSDGEVGNQRASPSYVTFHRAIDVCPSPVSLLPLLIAKGIDCLLTSGGASTALLGASTIKEMVKVSSGRILVMAGAGVSAKNAMLIRERTGVKALHGSFRTSQPGIMLQHAIDSAAASSPATSLSSSSSSTLSTSSSASTSTSPAPVPTSATPVPTSATPVPTFASMGAAGDVTEYYRQITSAEEVRQVVSLCQSSQKVQQSNPG